MNIYLIEVKHPATAAPQSVLIEAKSSANALTRYVDGFAAVTKLSAVEALRKAGTGIPLLLDGDQVSTSTTVTDSDPEQEGTSHE